VKKVSCLDECNPNEDCELKYKSHCAEFLSPRKIDEVAKLVHNANLQFGIRTQACGDFFGEFNKVAIIHK